jgi:hypothetical protein
MGSEVLKIWVSSALGVVGLVAVLVGLMLSEDWEPLLLGLVDLEP